jgi:hypothetical protein
MEGAGSARLETVGAVTDSSAEQSLEVGGSGWKVLKANTGNGGRSEAPPRHGLQPHEGNGRSDAVRLLTRGTL